MRKSFWMREEKSKRTAMNCCRKLLPECRKTMFGQQFFAYRVTAANVTQTDNSNVATVL